MATTKRASRRRKKRSIFGEIGAIALRRKLKFNRPTVLAVSGLLAVVGIAVVAFTFAASTYSFWTNSATPSTKAVSDTQPAELGLKFTADTAGTVNAVRFYKAKSNTGEHTGSLWNATGQRLATVTFVNETASGWQTASFAQPVPVVAGAVYTVSYHTNVGRYSRNRSYFTSARTQGPIRALANTASSPNGVYARGASAFPTVGDRASNYWVDVVFAPAPVATPTPTPVVTPTPTPTPTASSTPTPTPTPGTGVTTCPLPAYPNANCTGVPAGTALTVVNGDMVISTTGAVVDGKDIRGCVEVRAAGVTIKNSKVTCSSGLAVTTTSAARLVGNPRLTMQDTQIICGRTNGSTGLGDINFNAFRLDISGCENGFDADSDANIEDSYIHDLHQSATAHTDGLQSANGSSLVIKHNTIYANDGTSAININNNSSGPTTTNTQVSSNLLAGGAFTLYCPIPATSNFSITNNHFSKIFYSKIGFYGASSDCNEPQSGNVYHESGLPILLD